jgi:hypothetical protein
VGYTGPLLAQRPTTLGQEQQASASIEAHAVTSDRTGEVDVPAHLPDFLELAAYVAVVGFAAWTFVSGFAVSSSSPQELLMMYMGLF